MNQSKYAVLINIDTARFTEMMKSANEGTIVLEDFDNVFISVNDSRLMNSFENIESMFAQ